MPTESTPLESTSAPAAESPESQAPAAAPERTETPIESTAGESAESTPAELAEGAPPEAPEPADWISDDLVEEAQEAGLTRADLEGFSSLRDLEQYLYLATRQRLAAAGNGRQQAPQRPAAASPAAPAESAAPPSKDMPPLDPDEHGPALVEYLRQERAQREILAGRVEELLGHLQGQARVAEEHQFDGYLDELADSDLLGETQTLQQQSPQFRNRAKVWQVYQQLRATGELPTKAVVNRAFKYAFHDQLIAKEAQRLRQTMRQRSKKVLHGTPGKTQAVEKELDDVPYGFSETRRQKLLKQFAQIKAEAR